jgi:hypothetical protein
VQARHSQDIGVNFSFMGDNTKHLIPLKMAADGSHLVFSQKLLDVLLPHSLYILSYVVPPALAPFFISSLFLPGTLISLVGIICSCVMAILGSF